MPRKLFISLILAASTLVGAARERALILREPARPDTIRPLEVTFPEPQKNLIGKIIDYFEDSNKEKKSKKFDISFIGGPHYS
ncbi:MAG: hypothetical protein K2F79_01755, partial [Muribaculaceae bacterium]|nr:hypothetical protein [Muribaculaceae bacterium]